MRKITLSTLLVLAVAISSFAQTWENFNYQGVARDAQGEVIENQAVSIRVSLHEGTAVGAVVYQETHATTTNDFGLFNLAIGSGTVVSGTFGTIDWGNDDYYVQVEMDPAGGSAYADMGTSQLLAVPYAMYAANADVPSDLSGNPNFLVKFDGAQNGVSSSFYDNNGNLGIGITNATRDLHIKNDNNGTTGIILENPSTASFAAQRIDFENEEGQLAAIQVWGSGATLANQMNIFNNRTDGTIKMATGGLTRLSVANDGKVGIGTGSAAASFHVVADGSEMARFESSGNSKWISLYQDATRKGILWSSMDDIVLRADATAGKMRFQTNGNNDRVTIDEIGHIGIGTTLPSADARLHVNETTLQAAGLFGEAAGQQSYFTVNMPTTSGSWGIARFRDDGNSKVIIDNDAATYQLTVYGDAYSTGTWTASDKSLKRNITTISRAMENLMKLNPTSYYFENESESAKILSLPEELQFGLLAQDVKEVFPNLVKESVLRDEEGNVVNADLHGMNYTGLIPVLIKALQEHHELIEALQAEIEELKSE